MARGWRIQGGTFGRVTGFPAAGWLVVVYRRARGGGGFLVYPGVREEGVGGGVIALCSDCRVLSAASAGKEVGRLAALRVLASAPLLMGGGLPGGKAAEGGVMKCERYAGGSPASGW